MIKKKNKLDVNKFNLNARRDWGEINPATKVFKNKKKYNRKNKKNEKYEE